MSKCPACHRRLTWLEYSAYELVASKFKRIEGDNFEYSDWDTADVDVDTIEYKCPFCGEVVARREEEAKKFLSRP